MEVLKVARKVGKAAGKHCDNAEEVSMRIAQGFQFLALSSDAGLMSKAAREEFSAIDFTGEHKGSQRRNMPILLCYMSFLPVTLLYQRSCVETLKLYEGR